MSFAVFLLKIQNILQHCDEFAGLLWTVLMHTLGLVGPKWKFQVALVDMKNSNPLKSIPNNQEKYIKLYETLWDLSQR